MSSEAAAACKASLTTTRKSRVLPWKTVPKQPHCAELNRLLSGRRKTEARPAEPISRRRGTKLLAQATHVPPRPPLIKRQIVLQTLCDQNLRLLRARQMQRAMPSLSCPPSSSSGGPACKYSTLALRVLRAGGQTSTSYLRCIARRRLRSYCRARLLSNAAPGIRAHSSACCGKHFLPKVKPSSVAQTAHCVRIIFIRSSRSGAALHFGGSFAGELAYRHTRMGQTTGRRSAHNEGLPRATRSSQKRPQGCPRRPRRASTRRRQTYSEADHGQPPRPKRTIPRTRPKKQPKAEPKDSIRAQLDQAQQGLDSMRELVDVLEAENASFGRYIERVQREF